MSQSTDTSTAKSATKIMLAVMGSRILGLVREVVLNAIFGAGKELDAFIAAFRFPNLLRDLFAEGALSTAFVTTFSKKLAKDGKPAAFHLANLVFSSMVIVLGIVTLLGILFSDKLVWLITPGFYEVPGKAELTIHLTRIMFPFILLVSLAAVYMGLLNSLGSFGLPASASTAFNATSILFGLGIGYLFDHHLGPKAIFGFAIGTVLGGLVQLLIQIPRAIQLGFHLEWVLDWKDPALRHVVKLTIPAVVASAAVQVNVLVNTYFASFLGNGAVTWLNNSFRLMQLPIGMFGVAVSMVTLPFVSQSAAEADMKKFRHKVVEGLRLALFLTIPSSIGLAVLSVPIIGIIYERGAFTAYDTSQTGLALQAYAIGLASYACIKVLAPTFYALDSPSIPVRISIIGIILNLILNYVFIKILKLGIVGLPLSTSIVALINMLQLAWALRRKLGSLEGRKFLGFGIKLLLIAGIMGVAVWMGYHWIELHFKHKMLYRMSIALLIPAGVLLFSMGSWLCKLEEAHTVVSLIKKRLIRT
jgi:putative peptidoglycan lipid II flippase